MDAGGSDIRGHLQLHRRFEASLGSMNLYLKNLRERQERTETEIFFSMDRMKITNTEARGMDLQVKVPVTKADG